MESDYIICVIFTLKDEESQNKFTAFCGGKKGLIFTRSYDGCKCLDMYKSREEERRFIQYQVWESKQKQHAYIEYRHSDGTFTHLKKLFACPPIKMEIPSFSLNSPFTGYIHCLPGQVADNAVKDSDGGQYRVFKTDEEKIKEIIRDMCEFNPDDLKANMKYMHDDWIFIRPSGNSLDKEGWEEMMTNGDLKVEFSALTHINKINVCGCCAYVCYNQHSVFTYKDTKNNEEAVLTAVLRKYDGVWKVVQGQRSTGREPKRATPCDEKKKMENDDKEFDDF